MGKVTRVLSVTEVFRASGRSLGDTPRGWAMLCMSYSRKSEDHQTAEGLWGAMGPPWGSGRGVGSGEGQGWWPGLASPGLVCGC